MTSTSFNTGYSLNRNSSKVIKPPGGETADIFGSRAEPSYSSASSQAGSDVASSRIHIETDQQSIGGSSSLASGTLDGQQKVQMMMKQHGAGGAGCNTGHGEVSPNGSVDSGASSRQVGGNQQPLLMADDFKPTQMQDQSSMQMPPMNLQQQKLIQMQQQQQQQDLNRSPKKTIPVIRRNPITGEIYENPSNRQPAVVRVRQPPGGRSSGIF